MRLIVCVAVCSAVYLIPYKPFEPCTQGNLRFIGAYAHVD
jgi:hypothetical protein